MSKKLVKSYPTFNPALNNIKIKDLPKINNGRFPKRNNKKESKYNGK